MNKSGIKYCRGVGKFGTHHLVWLTLRPQDFQNKIFRVNGSTIHSNFFDSTRYVNGRMWQSQLNLCNRETFFFHTCTVIVNRIYDIKRTHKRKRFQVQEAVSGFNAWARVSSFDIDKHWHRWSHAIHSCLWLGWDHERTSYRWRQCECLASPLASLSIVLLLSIRPPIILVSLPQFTLWRSVIFLL